MSHRTLPDPMDLHTNPARPERPTTPQSRPLEPAAAPSRRDLIAMRPRNVRPLFPRLDRTRTSPQTYLRSTPQRQEAEAHHGSAVPDTELTNLYEKYINTATWGKTPTPGNMSGEEAATYMIERQHHYDATKTFDEPLWEQYHDDFEGWSTTDFETPHKDVRRTFRDFLLSRGVFVTSKQGVRIHIALHETLNTDEFHEWTDEEIAYQLSRRSFDPGSKQHPDHIQTPRLASVTAATRTPSRHLSPVIDNFPQDYYRRQTPNIPPYNTLPPHTQYAHFGAPTGVPPPTTPHAQQQFPQHAPFHQPQSRTLPPQAPSYNAYATWRQPLADANKQFPEKDKFSGQHDDVFEYKLQLLHSLLHRVAFPQEHWDKILPIMLKGQAEQYYKTSVAHLRTYEEQVAKLRLAYDNDQTQLRCENRWRATTLRRMKEEDPSKSNNDVFEALLSRLNILRHGVRVYNRTDTAMVDQILHACADVSELRQTLINPPRTVDSLIETIRSALTSYQVKATPLDFDPPTHGQYWTDRRYYPRDNNQRGRPVASTRIKRCYICRKPGCWSTRHSEKEREDMRRDLRNRSNKFRNARYIQEFLESTEGEDDEVDDIDRKLQQFIIDLPDEDDDFANDEEDFDNTAHFTTSYGTLNGPATIASLQKNSTFHAMTGTELFHAPDHDAFAAPAYSDDSPITHRYSDVVFHGILPDTGASGISTAGEGQFRALQRILPQTTLDTSTAGLNSVRFGKGSTTALGTTDIQTPIGPVTFHVVPELTPFLLSYQDMKRLRASVITHENVMIQGNKRLPLVHKWGHPWLPLDLTEGLSFHHMTEPELRQLHRRFGHPSVQRLTRLLQRAEYDADDAAIAEITKRCHQCQLNRGTPSRFKFTLKGDEDYCFNAEIIIDVFYLPTQSGTTKPVLHVIDQATSFQAARFLDNMTAKHTWEAFKECWIDTYLGPPEVLRHDAGTNFASAEFRGNASASNISLKEAPVEAHHRIGKVERYHPILKRAYQIIRQGTTMTDAQCLQAAVKAINDTAGPNGIVPTLLVFGAYPRMTDKPHQTPSTQQRAEAIQKATQEIMRLQAQRDVTTALATRNGPRTEDTTNLPLNANVVVYRENGTWTGPHRLIATNGQTCTLELPYGPVNFPSTVVRPYYSDNTAPAVTPVTLLPPMQESNNALAPPPTADLPAKRGRGRPKGSKNKPKASITLFQEQPNTAYTSTDIVYSETFLGNKERLAHELANALRQKGIIITPGKPFEASTKTEIDSLIDKGVFEFERYDPDKHDGQRLFKARLVHDIKGQGTPTPYEKSRLVIQGYNDHDKITILTAAPTVQRASQRIVLALAPSSLSQGMNIYLRDVTQAYVQSKTVLQRQIYATPPEQVKEIYGNDIVLHVIKPLYGLAESGTHWWETYFKHHVNNLNMDTSTFDPCLLISNTSQDCFGLVAMQTDDTLFLANESFANKEDEQLKKEKIIAKDASKLTTDSELDFNGARMTLSTTNCVHIKQKGQGEKIELIDASTTDFQKAYIQQRARGAYIASICQPEATFDLSIAAQHQEPSADDTKLLNKRLKWQKENLARGLTFVPMNLKQAKLFAFVDASFANNKDLSSQLGYVIILATEDHPDDQTAILTGNIIHWSSTKSKRVTRSVLASEIYAMTAGVDMALTIASTIKQITAQLNFPDIPTVVCTDSYSLYECVVKLGTTKEKRLMIDILGLRQSYERRELLEVRWISGDTNPADALTKQGSNTALKNFIDTNQLHIKLQGWVHR